MTSEREIAVAKFGSDTLDNISSHASRLMRLRKQHDIVVITSGAVRQGRQRLGERGSKHDAQTLAMLGSAGVAHAWEEAFERYGVLAGQVLVSHRELNDEYEGENLRAAYARARSHGFIPVINHNDFLARPGDADDELKELQNYTDNDRLAKDVAIHLGAKLLFLATGRRGFEVAGQIKSELKADEVDGLQQHVYAGSRHGTGGMSDKLGYAAQAARAGIRTYICSANADFAAVAAGREIATRVLQ